MSRHLGSEQCTDDVYVYYCPGYHHPIQSHLLLVRSQGRERSSCWHLAGSGELPLSLPSAYSPFGRSAASVQSDAMNRRNKRQAPANPGGCHIYSKYYRAIITYIKHHRFTIVVTSVAASKCSAKCSLLNALNDASSYSTSRSDIKLIILLCK